MASSIKNLKLERYISCLDSDALWYATDTWLYLYGLFVMKIIFNMPWQAQLKIWSLNDIYRVWIQMHYGMQLTHGYTYTVYL